MEIIVTEKKLTENIVGLKNSKYLLPQFIFNALKTHKTSLGDNPCFPLEGQEPFDYAIIKQRYKEIIDNLGDNLSLDDAATQYSSLLQECIEKEKPLRDLLSKICIEFVKQTLCVPQETVILHCNLVDEVSFEHSPRILPEDGATTTYTFDDVNDMEMTNNEVLKRRFVNALTQGASYDLMKQFDYSEIFKIDESLPKLYEKILLLNDYLLFNTDEKIDEKTYKPNSCVEVKLGNKNKKTTIKSQGIIFPFLLFDTFKGFFELFGSHGLPESTKKAMHIVRHADFVMADAWDARFGYSLWKLLSDGINDIKLFPYYFMELSKTNSSSIKEILSNTKQGIRTKQDIINYCEDLMNYEESPTDTSIDDNGKGILSDNTEDDGMFTLDELTNFNI